jgi:hypothetical protein
MDRLRVFVHALFFLIGALGLEAYAARTGNPIITGFLQFMRWGSYVPFALAAASALNHHRGMLILLVVVTIAVGAPTDTRALADQLAPIGVGILIGSFITSVSDYGGKDAGPAPSA